MDDKEKFARSLSELPQAERDLAVKTEAAGMYLDSIERNKMNLRH